MTDMSAIGGLAAGAAVHGLIDRHDLVATLDRADGGETSLLHTWADRPGQDYRIALMSVRPGPARRTAVLARAAGRSPGHGGA